MIRLAVVLFWLCATVAQAEALRVIAGEHTGFTRVAIIAARDIDATMAKEADEVVLTFAGAPHSIDTSDAFRRIGRTRIISVSGEGADRLRIVMACDCVPVMGRGAVGIITLDVTDPPELPQAAGQTRPPATRPAMTWRNDVTLPVDLRVPQTGNSLLSLPVVLPQSSEAHSLPDPETARGLQLQIARAVSQGLLDPAYDPNIALSPSTSPPLTTSGPDTQTVPRFFGAVPGLQVTAETPVATDALSPDMAAQFDRVAIGCIAAEDIAVPSWGSENAFSARLGDLQREVFTETSRLDVTAARRLAQHYVYYGMGAEARVILSHIAPAHAEDQRLLALADIVDLGQDASTGAFRAQAHCRTPVALWAVLADPDPSVTTDADIGAVVQAFAALPWHLKDHLGPLLVQRLRAAGKTEATEAILRIVRRATEESSPAVKIAEATVSLDQNDEAAAVDLLQAVAATNGQMSPAALVRLIDIEIAAGRGIDPETAVLAESYAREYRETPVGADLWRVNVLALAASGQFGQAFGMLRDPEHADLHDNLWSATLTALTRQAGDVPFARWAMNVPSNIRQRLAPDVANAVAGRLLALGFSTDAESYIAGPADGAVGRERKLLRAQAALDQNRPRRAEAELLGLDGPDIDRLRAEARLATGDYAGSQELFRSIDATDAETGAAFLAGNWPRIEETAPETLAAFGRLAQQAAPTVPEPTDDAPLAASRDMLIDSERARAVIADMLATIVSPEAIAADLSSPD